MNWRQVRKKRREINQVERGERGDSRNDDPKTRKLIYTLGREPFFITLLPNKSKGEFAHLSAN